MNTDIVFGDFPMLESPFVQLKRIEVEDLQELFAIYNNENVFTYCGILPKHNLKTVEKMIGHFERDYKKKSRIKWGIYSKAHNNKLVGIIEAMDFNQKVNMVTIGYYLAEEYWKKGIATEAVSLLITFLFEKISVNRIQAEVMPENTASKKVLLNNGLTKEGLLRQASVWTGKGVVDLEVYGLLREEYTIE
ncbi:GNAT family N-acetyltransferase [Bacillus alkalicellulosilyticus]|uniref:GNAT family N-acetyltransferase n=1 Tax=Alkalihalobacterium alkalicellulosilyticum TaxID=1912214 RepID=UPI000996CD98|nr:GNAT family protein [Bacillus alkalicellulosilyticus]